MKLLKGTAAIEKAISSIQTRGKKLDSDIHIAGCSCLQHIDEHGDVTLLNRLVQAMPKGSRVNALKEWSEVHGKVKYNNETAEFDFDKTSVTLLEEGMEKPWIEFKPEQKYKALDFNAALEALFKKAYERVDSVKGDKVDKKVLDKLAKSYGYTQEPA